MRWRWPAVDSPRQCGSIAESEVDPCKYEYASTRTSRKKNCQFLVSEAGGRYLGRTPILRSAAAFASNDCAPTPRRSLSPPYYGTVIRCKQKISSCSSTGVATVAQECGSGYAPCSHHLRRVLPRWAPLSASPPHPAFRTRSRAASRYRCGSIE